MLPEHHRVTLAKALEYASEAVKMDRSGTNVQSTIATYARCISLLYEIVKGGELSSDEKGRITTIVRVCKLGCPNVDGYRLDR